VRENIRNADSDDEEDDRAKITGAIVLTRSTRRSRSARQCRPNERHCGHHQPPRHIRLIVKKKPQER